MQMYGSMSLRKHAGIAALALMALLMLANFSFGSSATNLCSSLIPTTASSNSVIGNTSIAGGVIVLSGLIIMIMLTIAGMAFAIGYAFNIDKLTSFAKSEIGEAVITVLIILIFLGVLSATGSTIGKSGVLAKYDWTGIFTNDCVSVASTAFNTLGAFRALAVESDFYSLLASTSIGLHPNYWGIGFSPYYGAYFITQILKLLISFTGVIIALLFGVAVLLSLIYSLFPIFLYVGIVLRTIPWTRAAGGAFLGLFIGFYIFLPLIIAFVATMPPITAVTVTALTSDPFTITTIFNPVSDLSALISFIHGNVVTEFIESVVTPVMYLLLGTILAIMFSLDFAETVGDFLGAPSLSTSKALRGVI
ncbi:hypothetical protein M1373_01480 [Candidatus Marsarchaeota archaeon]|nr:hypothetical protein [Candidatus Marsarchaeota archaeon]MCL5404969.1 hypothetical protein [Candidatus Marsarchaeota archaeon]